MTHSEFQNLRAKISEEPLPLRVASNSMRPLLEIDDIVTVSHFREKPKPFDIVVYFFVDHIRCHFVWRNQMDFNRTLVTRSLENIFFDEVPIPQEHLLGILQGVKIPLFMRWKIIISNAFCFWKKAKDTSTHGF